VSVCALSTKCLHIGQEAPKLHFLFSSEGFTKTLETPVDMLDALWKKNW